MTSIEENAQAGAVKDTGPENRTEPGKAHERNKTKNNIAIQREVEVNDAHLKIKKEKEKINGHRSSQLQNSEFAQKETDEWWGIALSGGGIRSSTFCTGILQALAKRDHLKDFDYLSTVSGGGFIGCSLQWWWHGKHGVKDNDKGDVKFGVRPGDFPYGSSEPSNPKPDDTKYAKEQEANLSYLRNHGYYLTPGNGITLWSGLAVVIRTILLNLLVWIPAADGLFYLVWWFPADWGLIKLTLSYLPNGGSPLPESMICPRWAVDEAGRVVADSAWNPSASIECKQGGQDDFYSVLALPPLFAILIWLGYALLVVYVVGSLAYSIQTSQTQGAGGSEFRLPHLGWTIFAIILLGLGYYFYDRDPDVDGIQGGLLWLTWIIDLSWLKGTFSGISWRVDPLWVQSLTYGLGLFGGAILVRMAIILRAKWGGTSEFLPDMSRVYYLRRFFERTVSKLFKFLVGCLLLGFVPAIFVAVFTLDNAPGFTGLFSLAAGVAAALMAHGRAFRSMVSPGLAEKIYVPIGSGLFLVGVILLSYQIAMLLVEVDILGMWINTGMSSEGSIALESEFKIITKSFAEMPSNAISDSAATNLSIFLAFLILIAFAMAWFVNTNQISLNRFYRDRLMEAYMPHADAVRTGEVKPTPADALELHELWEDGGGGIGKDNVIGLYPLINTNCVMVNDRVQHVRLRGGDNYVLSPLYCGSTATGMYSTKDCDACRILTLPTAMATSGAAANPNSGFVGKGPTRERLLSIVMMLLNVRLGLWVVNPRLWWLADNVPRWLAWLIKLPRPNHIRPGAQYALSSNGFHRDSPFLELTDGGHFDNSGLYELIRRRCNVIVACDGEADKEFGFAGFVSLQRRVLEDFGVTFEFDKSDYPPEKTIPSKKTDSSGKQSYPKDAHYAERPFFTAKIKYPALNIEQDEENPQTGSWERSEYQQNEIEGTLIYIKSTMIEELSFATKGYKAQNSAFPHETTADQFFDPQQFEVYRELGYVSALKMIDDLSGDWKLHQSKGQESEGVVTVEPTAPHPEIQKDGN